MNEVIKNQNAETEKKEKEIKIFVNRNVIDEYRTGKSLNDSIRTVFEKEIEAKIEKDKNLKELTPLNLVMRDAGISKYSTVGEIMDTAAYMSSGIESNEWLFPAWIETMIREPEYGMDITSFVCDTTIGVNSNIIQAATIDMLSDENRKAIKMARIAEGADLPISKIKTGEKAITLCKHGRAIEMTYEAMRRIRIDLFQKHMGAIRADLARQRLNDAVATLQTGDGNNNKATKLATLASDAELTVENLSSALIDYWMEHNFAADTLIMGKDHYKKLVGMQFDPTMAQGASMRFTFKTPQLGTQDITLLCCDVPQIGSKDVIMVLNRANTLVRYIENGSNIQENQQFARSQKQLLTISENSGHAINTVGSNMYIEFTA